MKKIISLAAASLLALTATAADLTDVRIYINPGHGGWNGENDRNIETLTHALGDTLGFWESSSNLSKGLYLRDLLEAANATVYMSREDNRSGYRDNQYLPDDQQITDTGYGDRPLSTIAEEASANNVDAFLSIHSNAAGSTSAVNYLYLMCPGNGGEGDQNFRDPATKALADAAWPHIWNNPLTVWTHYTATNTKIAAFVTSYTVIGTALTVPGFLSEGEFHDYKPETHRLLNEDYRHLESLRFYYFYCDYFGADFPETGVLCGDVRDAHERLTEKLYTPYVNGSKDQYLPLNGAHVSLYDDSGTLCGEYTVDNDYNGVFAFWNLEPGNYTVKVTATDYVEAEFEAEVKAGETTGLNLSLTNVNYDPTDDRVAPDDYPTPAQEAGATIARHYAMSETGRAETSFLDGLNIRRSLIRGEKMYVLTDDSRIFVADAATGDMIAELSTAGVSGGILPLSDIAFTSDTVLMACNKEDIDFTSPSTRFKVYSWADDTADPVLVFESTKQGNWNTGTVGETFVVSGPSWNFRVYTPAVTTGSSKAIRIVGLEYDADEQLMTNDKYMMDANAYTEAAWGEDFQFTLSPLGDNRIIVDSKSIRPVEYEFNWDAPSRDPMILRGIVPDAVLPAVSKGANYFKYGGGAVMAAPYCADDATAVGVTLVDISEGLDHARLMTDPYPEAGLNTEAAAYMTAAGTVSGYDMTATVYAQHGGLARYTTVTTGQVANIYAYNANMEAVTDGYEFSFDLNEVAEQVTIEFVKEGEVLGSYEAGAKSKGANTVTVPESAIPYGEQMNWQIKAKGADVYRPTRISDDSDIFKFWNSFGVAIDNNPQSNYFGRVYVTNGKAGTASGRATGSGIYVLDPQLTDVTGQGNTAYDGGVDWYGTSSPYRVSVAPDGRVFIADYSDVHSGIWIMDPANPSGDFTELFAGCTRASSGLATNSEGVAVHGSISSCYIVGEGENTVLYTADEDMVVNGGTGKNILQYNIGTATNWTQAPSAVLYDRSQHLLLINTNINIAPDGRGGWWFTQYRATETKAEPCLVHFNGTAVDFHSGTDLLIGNGRNAGLAVSPDGSRLATTGPSAIYIWDVTYNEAGVPSITRAHTISGSSFGLGASSNDVAFDWAGNVYYVSNSSERLSVIALPKAENSAVTPGKASQTITRAFTAAVSDLEAAVDFNRVTLSWTAPEALEGISFNIYQGDELLGNTAESSYVVENLNNGTYTFEVAVVSGDYEAERVTVSATVAMSCGPVTNLSATLEGNNTVVLAWEAPEGVEAAARYNVYRDDQLLETIEETTYTDTGLEAGKTYRYAVTAVYGDYETEPATETVSTVITGIEQTEQALTVYPNPTDGLVNIELAEPIQTIQVYDMNGRLVLRRDHLSTMRETIDLSDCKPGNYLLKVNSFTYRVIRK